MKRPAILRLHRKTGTILGLLILAQALTGTILTLAGGSSTEAAHAHSAGGVLAFEVIVRVFAELHHGVWPGSGIIRIIIGLGAVFMASSGLLLALSSSGRR